MLLRLTAQRQTKKNCKYRRQFCKSVEPFHAKEVCPTFWDRPPSKLLSSPGVFFAYSDADIEVLDFITICKNRTANVDFYALGSG